MNKKIKLLCTFTNEKEYKGVVEDILNKKISENDKILVVENESKDSDVIYCIYDSASDEKLNDTIIIHRNKKTNTLYTINGLNLLVELENGIRNKDYQIN